MTYTPSEREIDLMTETLMHRSRLIAFPLPLWASKRLAVEALTSVALAAHDAQVREDCAKPGTIAIPRPHVPYGPEQMPEDEADAMYLREAARSIEGGYPAGGSNVTAMVVKLLRDAAAAIRANTGEQKALTCTTCGGDLYRLPEGGKCEAPAVTGEQEQ